MSPVSATKHIVVMVWVSLTDEADVHVVPDDEPGSLPAELRCVDGVRITGLRARSADAVGPLFAGLDRIAREPDTYVMAEAGLYCSLPRLRQYVATAAADAPSTTTTTIAVDFTCTDGVHVPRMDALGSRRPLLAAAARDTLFRGGCAVYALRHRAAHGAWDAAQRATAELLARDPFVLAPVRALLEGCLRADDHDHADADDRGRAERRRGRALTRALDVALDA